MGRRKENALNSLTRSAVIIITLGAVCYLAVFGTPQVAPLAASALFAVLIQGLNYEFRGRLEAPTTDVVQAGSPAPPVEVQPAQVAQPAQPRDVAARAGEPFPIGPQAVTSKAEGSA